MSYLRYMYAKDYAPQREMTDGGNTPRLREEYYRSRSLFELAM
jgi:hypothetical protein